MHKPIENIIAFVLQNLDGTPLAARAQIYNDLAEFAVNAKEAANFRALANGCAALARNHQQLALDFRR